MRMSPRLLGVLRALLMSAVMACSGGAPTPTERAPTPLPPGRELALTFDAPASTPLQVVSVSPQDAVSGTVVQINVVFNKPVRAVELAENEAPPGIEIVPALAGRWAWVGTGALTFVPDDDAVRSATQYRVVVPAGLAALDGTTLAEPYGFEFETPRPELLDVVTADGKQPLHPRSRWIAEFNLPVTPSALNKVLRIRASEPPAPPVDVAVDVQRDKAEPTRLLLIPRAPLPLGTHLEVVIEPGLESTVGPLPALSRAQREFDTYGKLRAEFSCGHGESPCSAGPRLRFTNPVWLRAVQGKVRVASVPGLRVVSLGAADEPSTEFALWGRYERNTHYQVEVAAGVRDIYGQVLEQSFTEGFQMGEGQPMVEVGATGGLLEPALGTQVAIATTNVESYEALWSLLSPEQLQHYLSVGAATLPEREFQRQRVSSWRPLNRQHLHSVSLESLRGQSNGAVALSVLVPGVPGAFEENLRVVHSTDLAVRSVHSSAGGMAWVTRLSDGSSVGNATVRVVGLPGTSDRRFVTDDSGLVKFPVLGDPGAFEQRTPLLVAEAAGDWSYAPLAGPSSYEYRTLISLHTERDLYRPGDEIQVKGWLRAEQASGTEVLVESSAQVQLLDGENVTQELNVTTNTFGGFDATLTLPKGARLGWHTIRVLVGERREDVWIRVGEYRSAEFTADVALSRKEHTRGESVVARISGSYLFGAPMNGASVSFVGDPVATTYNPPGTEGFATDAWEQQDVLGEELNVKPLQSTPQIDALLDERGQRSAELKPQLEMLGPVTLTFSATIHDATRQAVSAGDPTTIHPGGFYLGVQVPDAAFKPGQTLSPKVVAVEPTGARVVGKRVKVELYRLPRGDGNSQTRARKVGQCEVVSKAAPVSCGLRPTQGGAHVVLVRAKDAQLNPLFAATSFYVDGWSHGAPTDTLQVVLDKPRYRVGSTARVTVMTPVADANVLLTVEQASVLWTQSRRAEGKVAHFDVPVTEAMGGNVDVVAHVVRRAKPVPRARREGIRPWDAGPWPMVERAQLLTDQSHRRLRVKITPEQTTTTPGAVVKVRFEVVDGLGRPHPAELAVSAVDEGVLSMTDYRARDPFDAFTPRRENVLGWQDSRNEMGWLFTPNLEERIGWRYGMGFGSGHGRLAGSHSTRSPKLRMGQVSVSDGANPRADFRTTPYWNPSVVTDQQGRAEVNVTLSQLLTRFRVSAIAVAKDDYFGEGQSAIETQKPLMARPAMPRFIRVGDRFDAGVVVSSIGLTSPNTQISVRASGVNLEGPAQKVENIDAGASKEVRFGFRAATAGTARFDFEIAAGKVTDRVLVELPVYLAVTPQAVALYGKTDGAQAEAIGDLKGAARTFGGLAVTTSSTALVGLGEGMEQLLQYPYGCTEQLSSRLLPLLPLRDLAKDFGVELPTDLGEEIQTTVDQIAARQRSDGGFGLWNEDPESHPWLSAYVYRTLHEAARRGVRVSASVLLSAVQYLQRYISAEEGEYYRPILAQVAHVLAETGDPSTVAIERLMVNGERDEVFVQALILETLALSRPKASAFEASWVRRASERIAQLTKRLEGKIRLSSNRAFVEAEPQRYGWLFDSSTRTNAMVLSALLSVNPKHPLAERMARGLLAERRGGTWGSTQETAYALLALDSYRRKQEAVTPNFEAVVRFGNQELARTPHRGRSLQKQAVFLQMAQLPPAGSRLVFEKRGEGTLFYQALLRYSPAELPRTPLEHGFRVTQSLHSVARGALSEAIERGYAPGESKFPAGGVVLGQLTVTTATGRDFVAIEAPLPAGLEAIDTSLAIHQGEGLADQSRGWNHTWHRRELRDDRVLFFINSMPPGVYRFRYFARATVGGDFTMPPATTQEMYAPENFGRTGAQAIEIR
jgi:alpha-2-macroglobulin